MNERAQAFFDNDTGYPLLTESNNQNLAFSFTNITEPGAMGMEATDE